jgi:two-component system osmolarity sensor histidine kinase EnvZ
MFSISIKGVRKRWPQIIPWLDLFRIKKYLPKNLYARSLMIIVTPMIILQIVTTYIFFEQHWNILSRRLSGSVAGEIAFVLSQIEQTHPRDPGAIGPMLIDAESATGVAFAFTPDEILPNVEPGNAMETYGDTLVSALAERLRRPFRLRDAEDDRIIVIEAQSSDGVLRAWVNRKRIFTSTTYVFVLWMVGTSLLLFGIASVFMRNQVRPIRRLAEAAERFGKGQPVGEVKLEGATEVRRAALEFSHMRERITRQLQQRMEMLAGVSHDLRTPLTRLKLSVELLGAHPDQEPMRQDILEMEKMLNAYLAFVKGEGRELSTETDLLPMIDGIFSTLRRGPYQDRHLLLHVGDDVGPLLVTPEAMRRCLNNILQNAARHAQRIDVTLSRQGGFQIIEIRDTGPGIPAAMREEIFRPFFRLEAARTPRTLIGEEGGVGLGLTIARDIVRGHGGEISLSDNVPHGLVVTIRLPL